MSDSYYRFFPGDYLRDTSDLNMTEHGAYHLLLDYYYASEFLPADRDRLYRICKVMTEHDKSAVDYVIKRFFTENGNGNLINRRAEREIENRKAFIAEQSRKGKLSAAKRWPKDNHGYNHGSTDVVTEGVTEGQPKSNLPSPSPSPKKELKKRVGANPAPPEPLTKEDLTESSMPKIKNDLATLTETLYRENIFPDAPKFRNQMLKQGKNPRAIAHAFIRCQMVKPEEPWAYCMKIMQVEDGNYNERDSTKTV